MQCGVAFRSHLMSGELRGAALHVLLVCGKLVLELLLQGCDAREDANGLCRGRPIPRGSHLAHTGGWRAGLDCQCACSLVSLVQRP